MNQDPNTSPEPQSAAHPGPSPEASMPTAAGAAAGQGSGEIPSQESEDHPTAAELAVHLADAQDQVRRLAADIDNLRKRHAVELAQARQFAIESFAEALLPAADSLELALSVPNQTPEGLRSGVDLTLRQLVQAFEKGRLVPVSPTGEKFDPNRHQAISMVDGAQAQPPVASGHVVQVMQKGYLIGDRVLRPALVSVAS